MRLLRFQPNQRLGKLVVISQVEGKGSTRWRVKCDCGTEKAILQAYLVDGTQSCGCLQREKKNRLTHGQYGTAEYHSWQGMKARCQNPNSTQYKWYGARGITVCERWQKFEHFLADMGVKPSAGHSIDRIDSNGNYEPFNCRWAPKKVQARNTRTNRLVTIDGVTQSFAAWVEQVGRVQYKTAHYRLQRGWGIKRAVGLE